MTRPRVAVLFFGMSRCAAITAGSIRAQVLDHPLNQGLDLFLAASLNHTGAIRNPRNGERGVRIDRYDIDQLPCDLNLFIRQDDAAVEPWLAMARRHDDYYRNNYLSCRFILHQLNTLRHGIAVLEAGGLDRFSAIAFLRPDLLYEDPIDMAGFVGRHAGGHAIALPAWHAWGGYNDRFAIATVSAARDYARRIDLVEAYCRASPLHAERLLAHALRRGGVAVELLQARAHRVRSTGQHVEEDYTKGGPPGGRPAPAGQA